ncbi:DoxX family protein [Variovorax paradoxus]|nr:DoxX family protein [Variovorax paradoxus]
MKSHSESFGFTPEHELIVGRVLIAALFLVAGLRKIMNWDATTAGFSKLGVPVVDVVLPLVVLIELLGGFMLVFGWRERWVAYVLAAFTLAAGIIGHAFWNADAAQFGNQLNHFLKNLAVCGGLVCLASISRRSA